MDLNQLKATLFFDAAKRLANDPQRIQLLLSEMNLKLISKLTVEKKSDSNVNK